MVDKTLLEGRCPQASGIKSVATFCWVSDHFAEFGPYLGGFLGQFSSLGSPDDGAHDKKCQHYRFLHRTSQQIPKVFRPKTAQKRPWSSETSPRRSLRGRGFRAPWPFFGRFWVEKLLEATRKLDAKTCTNQCYARNVLPRKKGASQKVRKHVMRTSQQWRETL